MVYKELCPAGSLPQVCLDDCFVDRLFHIFIPQTVDHGIQHGNHCGVKHSHHLPLLHRLFSGPPEIHEDESPVKHGDGCQVGPTRGECLPPAIGRAHAQHGRYDEGVGNENHREGIREINPSNDNHGVFFNVDPSTGNLDKRRVSTIEVVDFKVSTEVQAICPQRAD